MRFRRTAKLAVVACNNGSRSLGRELRRGRSFGVALREVVAAWFTCRGKAVCGRVMG